MLIKRKMANAIGGKTARACDSCLRKRARWYCTADDAFLCQACDSSVHSANLLASRHERVRIEKVPNFKPAGSTSPEPAWHQGFTRKARTPRPIKPVAKSSRDGDDKMISNPLALVPEITGEENLTYEDEDHLLCRVPVCDPFLCDVPNIVENNFGTSMYDEACELDTIHGFNLPSDMDFVEFAADVESLLGGGLDHHEKPCEIKDFRYFDGIEEEENILVFNDCLIEDRKLVKVENDNVNWEFDDGVVGQEEKNKMVPVDQRPLMGDDGKAKDNLRNRFLRLDYEEVINAWNCKTCPWIDGARPDLSLIDCWPDFIMGSHLVESSQKWIGGQVRCGDVDREARVTRYREKRRTRLFSKKIRYQVRKLNAEKRPRMKGRFVKRSSSTSSSLAPPLFPNYHPLSNV